MKCQSQLTILPGQSDSRYQYQCQYHIQPCHGSPVVGYVHAKHVLPSLLAFVVMAGLINKATMLNVDGSA